MRSTAVLIAVVTFAALGGCRSGDGNAKAPTDTGAAPTTAKTSVTPKSPEAQKTYIPAPGDPKTHVLNVTIRDKANAYTVAAGRCASSGATDLPDTLVVSGPDNEFAYTPLKEFPIPKRARLLRDGTCEATMTVTITFAPRYSLGVAMEGHGISGHGDPVETRIVTKGRSQHVVVLN